MKKFFVTAIVFCLSLPISSNLYAQNGHVCKSKDKSLCETMSSACKEEDLGKNLTFSKKEACTTPACEQKKKQKEACVAAWEAYCNDPKAAKDDNDCKEYAKWKPLMGVCVDENDESEACTNAYCALCEKHGSSFDKDCFYCWW